MKSILKQSSAVIYIRQAATQVTSYTNSIAGQLEILRKVADDKNLEVSTVFIDHGKSAVQKRPAFEQMIALVKRGDVNTIICSRLTSLSRNESISRELIELFASKKLRKIITIDSTYDTDNNDDMLKLNMCLGMFLYWSKMQSRSIRRGIQAKKAMQEGVLL